MSFVKRHPCKVLNFIGGIYSTDSEVKSMNYFVFVHPIILMGNPIILMEQQQVYGTHAHQHYLMNIQSGQPNQSSSYNQYEGCH